VFEPITAALLSNGIVFIMFYVSLTIAKVIANRLTPSLNKLFPLAIFSGCICSLLSIFFSSQLSGHPLANFFCSYPFKGETVWFYSSTHFLIAFLLINCSKFKKCDWKVIFFLLPLVNIWLYRFPASRIPLAIEEGIFLICLIFFSLFFGLKYEPDIIKLQ